MTKTEKELKKEFTCHVTRMGEEDRTLLYVMDSSKFPAWISDFGKETGIEKNHE